MNALRETKWIMRTGVGTEEGEEKIVLIKRDADCIINLHYMHSDPAREQEEDEKKWRSMSANLSISEDEVSCECALIK